MSRTFLAAPPAVTWRVEAHCPGCRALVAWKRRVPHVEATAVDKAESIRAKCETHGYVDARVSWTIEPNALGLPVVEKPSDLLAALEAEVLVRGPAPRPVVRRRGHLTLLRGGRS